METEQRRSPNLREETRSLVARAVNVEGFVEVVRDEFIPPEVGRIDSIGRAVDVPELVVDQIVCREPDPGVEREARRGHPARVIVYEG